MSNAKYYIKIKEKEIPVIIREYKHSYTLKIYFKGNILNISKPKRISKHSFEKFIKENEDNIYNQYMKILKLDSKDIKHWVNGEKFSYLGEDYTINVEEIDENKLKVKIDTENKKMLIKIPEKLKDDERKENVDKAVKKLLKIQTDKYIEEKLPYWSKITNLSYTNYMIGDTTSKFGSCSPSKRKLYFSNRLIMLPTDKIDAIIVHELCHLKYKDHSKNFYNLVKEYIPNYQEIDKWLKTNSYKIMI